MKRKIQKLLNILFRKVLDMMFKIIMVKHCFFILKKDEVSLSLDELCQNTPLHLACQNDHIDIVKLTFQRSKQNHKAK